MRTNIDLDDELLQTLKELARRQGNTPGQVVSALVRRSLSGDGAVKVRNGVRLFAAKARSAKADLSLVNALRDGA